MKIKYMIRAWALFALISTAIGYAQDFGFVYFAPSPTLNRSIRAEVTEDNPLIIGIVIGKGYSNAVGLVRAIGPGLERFGVKNILKRPHIDVYRDDEVWATAGDWRRDIPINPAYLGSLRQLEKAAGASPLDIERADVALPMSLPEGRYNIVVRSEAPVESGVVLLEMFDLPGLTVPNSRPTQPQFRLLKSEVGLGYELTFFLFSSDKDGEKVQYGIDWDESGYIEENEWTPFVNPAIATPISHVFTGKAGKRTVAFLARDPRNTLSPPNSFIIEVTNGRPE